MQRIKQIYTNLISRDQSKSVSSAFYSAFKLLILKSSLLIICTLFTLHLFAQEPEYPDSGFTNKAEAKNLTINGKKEGKWCEYYSLNFVFPASVTTDTSKADFYELSCYKKGVLSGPKREYNMQGILTQEIPYINGVKNGIWKEYYDDGKLQSVITCKQGKWEGMEIEYYESGKEKFERHYTNNKQDGVEKWYEESGKLAFEQPYTKGFMDGVYKEYYDNGNVRMEIGHTMGKLTFIKGYYEDGKIKTEEKYINKKMVTSIDYDENGNEIKDEKK